MLNLLLWGAMKRDEGSGFYKEKGLVEIKTYLFRRVRKVLDEMAEEANTTRLRWLRKHLTDLAREWLEKRGRKPDF